MPLYWLSFTPRETAMDYMHLLYLSVIWTHMYPCQVSRIFLHNVGGYVFSAYVHFD